MNWSIHSCDGRFLVGARPAVSAEDALEQYLNGATALHPMILSQVRNLACTEGVIVVSDDPGSIDGVKLLKAERIDRPRFQVKP